jgi:hypothetical protein
LTIDGEDDSDVDEIKRCEDVLRQADVGSLLSGIVQAKENVHKASWVPVRNHFIYLNAM